MALITLDVAEAFEHSHDHVSTTCLVDGQAELLIEGVAHALEKEKTIVVPANTSHTIRNCGNTSAIISCGHS